MLIDSALRSRVVNKLAADKKIDAKDAAEIARTYRITGTTHADENHKILTDIWVLTSGARPDVFVSAEAKHILNEAQRQPVLL